MTAQEKAEFKRQGLIIWRAAFHHYNISDEQIDGIASPILDDIIAKYGDTE